MLLQLLDDGRLTDGQGHVVDFTQTIVLMTSNLRSEEELKRFFRPEFLNRLDEVLTYGDLGREQLADIVRVQVARLAEHLTEQDINLELDDSALTALADEGYDPEFGARPLKRAIQRRIQNALADRILTGELGPGDTAWVSYSDGAYQVAVRRAQAETEVEAGVA